MGIQFFFSHDGASTAFNKFFKNAMNVVETPSSGMGVLRQRIEQKMILLTSKDYCTLKSPRTSEYECVRQGKFACVPYTVNDQLVRTLKK